VKTAPIAIGNDVWIGYGASIAKGVTIGEGAVVAAHAVVLDDVEPFTVVAGFPAKHLRNIEGAEAMRKAIRLSFEVDRDHGSAEVAMLGGAAAT
jgi:acetyltransferase-like isoleucine patch superfamily enzyme